MNASVPGPRTAPEGRGLLLHLAGPLQSWGERSQFNERDTAPFPTRSGVIGLLASALGRPRGAGIDDLATLSLTVRADRPGVALRDLHTVGGGLQAGATVTTADGKKRSGAAATLLSHRYYLADAAFTAALTGDPVLLAECAQAVADPHWPPFLGRRSCPPEGPLLLGLLDDALHHLVHLPIARRRPADDRNIPIVFHGDRPLTTLAQPANDGGDGTHPAGQVTDEPSTFHPRHRSYRARSRYQRTIPLPAEQCAGLGTTYLTALGDYLTHQADRPRPESTRA
ncbi:type I-E CRISPR-associated protein Cas5/CasD [Streptomyces sp. BE20]|uniref:type I-E CRISPR-associated protein Cas5/CasD n=1 Tax=Streptomyces sp. BE20 TaxID=3002525 RepID=UPI002E781B74|nr:type I-E CRISPR-associated protein Cas5/CasD [Streptomyces sp. BE20]MEE1821652.1 type I-E CRISPR-associated protein Cas5/CasD [Streptomyces sp. BE20]